MKKSLHVLQVCICCLLIFIWTCSRSPTSHIEKTKNVDPEIFTIDERFLEPEPIVFAINKTYADSNSGWKAGAERVISRINDVFLKTTLKQYVISEYKIYNDIDYEETWQDPEFHIKWNGIGTTTIIALIHDDDITVDELRMFSPSLIYNCAQEQYINEIKFFNVLLAQPKSLNLIITGNYEVPLHELGHLNGLAVPDWYLYKYKDCTNVKPILPSYEIRNDFPSDPMSGNVNGPFQFCSLNSTIINMNLDHKFGYLDINKMFAKTCKVFVTNEYGKPVKNAEVRIFNIRKNCFYCNTSCDDESGIVNSGEPEQVHYTNSNGYVEYVGPSGEWDFIEDEDTKCLAKAIKVYHGEKSTAKYVKFLDLQEDYILNRKTVHIDHIILN